MESFNGQVKFWQKTDIDGFFGLFTNNLTNLLVMAGLLISTGIPATITFGSILPAVGLSIFASSVIYSFLAFQLVKKEKRNTVTALPSGTSVPHMFLIIFLIMGPVYRATGDPYLAWYASLAWGFVEGIIELSGSIFGAKIRKLLPRSAMLGSLAGASITFIAMAPAMQTFDLPYIGLISLIIILLGWFGKVKFPFHLPVGLVAIIIGTVIGWATGVMDLDALIASANSIEFSIPSFSINRIVSGFSSALPFIVSAIPLGIYNMLETIDNVESAEVAGDSYSTTTTMIADGSTSILASLFGSPFPTAVFIGHPGWKEAGARIGYTLATGVAVLAITWLGLISLLLSIIPLAAVLPILIYIGLMIGAQAFQEVDLKYAPAVILALIPWLADWGKNIIGNALTAAGTDALTVSYEAIEKAGLPYGGLVALSSGAIIISMLWASILTFIIDQKFHYAALTAILGSFFSFFGLIHYETVGIGVGLETAISYLIVAIILVMFYKKNNGGINDD
ncbi:putative MFS transporter, AGZA family, xanthine/uracil permease [Carnobacterium iners]|uniref:Putative MFS transporter, AGZA family, xanthine/uracil permease n=1 Tax=Carnobacterium iners TaxID=1073423 RepID=A0A1X7MNV0_9LACT|nr:xanthine permease [Carnobacterium iners]SEL08874.1 putative MFS transporter, AGZA family, xanthine/uracil permease [Carnobacterium iners]SMH26510.1 putative MFS transporter, AGZA family, xanthine/uracil permease [Carnobacterium iners]